MTVILEQISDRIRVVAEVDEIGDVTIGTQERYYGKWDFCRDEYCVLSRHRFDELMRRRDEIGGRAA